jgi:hypothetical protein
MSRLEQDELDMVRAVAERRLAAKSPAPWSSATVLRLLEHIASVEAELAFYKHSTEREAKRQ